MANIVHRVSRFGLVGIICTLLAYIVFVVAARYVHFAIANLIAWAICVVAAFIMHRSFTFGVVGAQNLTRDFMRFATGAIGQLGLATAGYWILIGLWHLPPIIAFPINLVFTASSMFLYLNLFVFKSGR